MRGLILKDFYIIRDALLLPLLIMAVLGIALSIVSSPWLLIIIAGTSFGMMAVTTIQSDKVAQWDKFSVTLPVSRVQIISSKYCLYLLLSIFGVLVSTIICAVASTINSGFDISTLLMYVYFAMIMTLLPASVNIPCSFLLDGEKSIAGVILSYVVTAGAFTGLRALLSHFMDIDGNSLFVYGIVSAFSVVAYLFSWLISPKILSHKEL